MDGRMVPGPASRAPERMAVGRPRAPQGGRGSLSWPRRQRSARALSPVRESLRPLPAARPTRPVIREATDADAALVQELWHAFNGEVPDLPWREDDEDDFAPDLVLIADDDGAIALTRRGARAWFVDVVYVRPDARRRGLGTELMRAAAEHVGPEGVLELEVLESNEDARRLYERLGFGLVERILAAPARELVAVPPSGPSYGAVHVQSDDADLVRRNAVKALHAEPTVTLGSG